MIKALSFVKAGLEHKEMIFSWLAEPYVQEFWDNTQEHKDDIVNFMEGRKTPSNYCGGEFIYWLAQSADEPFAMLMTLRETQDSPIDAIKKEHLSKNGHTYGLDFMIGNKDYFGKGYAAETLSEFIDYFRQQVDKKADTFLIDPELENTKAMHVYQKAGFVAAGKYVMEGNLSGSGKEHCLLVKRF